LFALERSLLIFIDGFLTGIDPGNPTLVFHSEQNWQARYQLDQTKKLQKKITEVEVEFSHRK